MNRLFAKAPNSLLGSQSLTVHLARGALAFALLAGALQQQHAHPVVAAGAALAAVVVMRGCPMCWTIGLVETVARHLKNWRTGVSRPGVSEPDQHPEGQQQR